MNMVRMHLLIATIHSDVLTSTLATLVIASGGTTRGVHTRLLPPMHVLTYTETVIGAASQGATPMAGRQLGKAATPRVVIASARQTHIRTFLCTLLPPATTRERTKEGTIEAIAVQAPDERSRTAGTVSAGTTQ